MATLEELEATLQSMQEQLRLLEVRLDHERSLQRRLMRDTHQCPACGQEKIFFVNQLEVYAGGSTGALRVATKSIWTGSPLGVVHAHVCANCGHTELQIDDPSSVEGKKNVSVLPPIPRGSEDPYR
jgi:predicted nucleic-acid-binding Zn-ribbon protein